MTEANADAIVTLTVRLPAFLVSGLDAITAGSRPVAPTFRAPSRIDLIRSAIGEFIASREAPAPVPPLPATRPRVTTYPPRRVAR